jgi:two-component system chemotaxis response regulator CheB
MDIRLPGMNGLEATQRIMAEQPTPIVVIAGSVHSDDLNIAMNALKAGALSVLEKPHGLTHENYGAEAQRICTQLYIMSDVSVIRQRRPPLEASSRVAAFPSRPPVRPGTGPLALLGVVASTGGPNALVQLLQGLGPDFGLPIAVVQHISPSFHHGFVDWLGGVTPQFVCVAEPGQVPQPGSVYVAPPDHHLEFNREQFRLIEDPPLKLQRPSGTRLFSSMAATLGPRAVGVLLTGMGDDGADGLVALRKAGGYTIAEDASTCVVYGMPAAAVERGGVIESLPLTAIAPRLLALCAREEGVR